MANQYSVHNINKSESVNRVKYYLTHYGDPEAEMACHFGIPLCDQSRNIRQTIQTLRDTDSTQNQLYADLIALHFLKKKPCDEVQSILLERYPDFFGESTSAYFRMQFKALLRFAFFDPTAHLLVSIKNSDS
ncbi:hypothetical protein GPK34_09430 [Secundilactobacillus kimchicus]|uniref:Uncharacterized protein n=1 Tax=Secundilactobacillus kimchicus JCM 15530 TaxID=1302272 RepID=A0A0R1HLH7_9LACO|nr:hypothetical protein [Secundilactobacillus kimchicus]KRK47356.1 hypothetical protein FC96_GL002475 [Secundilactobacillus kimchicus JCM 15530]MBT9672253.1 hypothetical protein [Secundilactobacillus kimchicus]